MTKAPRYRCSPFDDRVEPPAHARVLHFFRHGEAVHQVRNAEAEIRGEGCRCFDAALAGGVAKSCPYWSEDLVDAPLTAAGREQTAGRGAALAVDRVLTSPTTRTLETSVLAFPPACGIVALPELRPRIGRHMHSKCSPRSLLVQRFPRVDFTRIPDESEDRLWSPETEPREALEERAARFLETVFSQPERRVAVVTHFTVLLALLLPADDTFTLGPSRREPGSPALLDASGCADPEALRVPVKVGEARSLLVEQT